MNNMSRIEFTNLSKEKNGFDIVSLESLQNDFVNNLVNESCRCNFYAMIFVTAGNIIHEIDHKQYIVKMSEILLISNNRVNRYINYCEAKGYVLIFTEGFLCKYLSNNSDVKKLFESSYSNPHIMNISNYSNIFTSLYESIHHAFANRIEVSEILYELVSNIVKTISDLMIKLFSENENIVKLNNPVFIEFVKLVDENLHTKKTVESYANMLHVSQKTVNQMTRKAIDMSAKQYIIAQIILRIKLKLSFEDQSISQISDELGFSEAANMTNFFRKHTDISPMKFREINRNTPRELLDTESMDLEYIRESIEERVYLITKHESVPLHKHLFYNEIFYCIKGSGFGVLKNDEQKIKSGDIFNVAAGIEHSLRSDEEMYVLSILIPVLNI